MLSIVVEDYKSRSEKLLFLFSPGVHQLQVPGSDFAVVISDVVVVDVDVVDDKVVDVSFRSAEVW